MLFNSFEFLLFFPIVTALYWLLPHRWRWSMLLTASCIFYMRFVPEYILILLVTILIDYFAGMKIEDAKSQRAKKLWLWISVVSTIMVLVIFKYSNFININVHSLAETLGWNYPLTVLEILLPIGLSFHTFQSLSYVIEVYRGHQKTERHFGIYSLYVMFYPQLVAGPIERPQNLLHQFHERHQFSYEDMTQGLKLMAWGLFKKMVIADRLSLLVDEVYNQPNEYAGWSIIVAALCFSIQIYCDFSGYSDIAIGTGRTMGFRMMVNFNRPYFSKSIREFWGRWHISLSTWFRDYVYIPLGGSRVPFWRWQFNLAITFLISGLWHGAAWTFIVWGALHAFFQAFGNLTQARRQKINDLVGLREGTRALAWVQVITTFLLVSFAWVFFRAASLDDAFVLLQRMVLFSEGLPLNFNVIPNLSGTLQIGLLCTIILMSIEYFTRNRDMQLWLNSKPLPLRWTLYVVMILSILHLGVYGHTNFIYFQF